MKLGSKIQGLKLDFLVLDLSMRIRRMVRELQLAELLVQLY
jgi:hypothetical protein